PGPPGCERVSAGKPTFAPGAGAPTVGAGSVCLCRSTAGTPDRLGAKGFQPTSPHSPPGAGAPTIRRASVGAPPGRDRLGAMRCQPAGRPAAKALEVILDESVGYRPQLGRRHGHGADAVCLPQAASRRGLPDRCAGSRVEPAYPRAYARGESGAELPPG